MEIGQETDEQLSKLSRKWSWVHMFTLGI